LARGNKMFLVETRQNETNTDIIVYSRDETGKKHVTTIDNFLPYFYIDEEIATPDRKEIKSVTSGYVDYLGNKVKKITCYKSTDIKPLRELFARTYEADILLSHRYMIDVVGEIKPYPLKLLSIDIELDTNDSFPDMDNPNQSVTSICMKDSMNNVKTKIILKYPLWDKETVEKLLDEGVIICDSEEEVLGTFISTFKEYDADVITGWNVADFDMIYLFKRMKQLQINYDSMSPMNVVFQDKWSKEVIVKGRIILDMMKSYRHFRKISNQGELESYSLEFVSQEVLGLGKIKHTATYGDMWRLTPLEHIAYNMRDV
jgi:DNA polymerase elongation subunit (family B)